MISFVCLFFVVAGSEEEIEPLKKGKACFARSSRSFNLRRGASEAQACKHARGEKSRSLK